MNLAGRLVALSGSKGFVGRHVLRRLKALGAEVRELTLEDGFDITNWEQVVSIGRFDAFVHLAARTFIPDSFAHPRDTLQVNCLGTLNALEACRLHSAKIIFASTYVYGEPRHLPIREDHPLAAMNPYTESKLLGERLCESYHRDYGLRCVVLRAFNIYGPGQSSRFLIPSIIEQARHGRVRLKSATPRRDFVHVQDVSEAYAQATAFEKDGFAVFNIGSGISYSVSDVATLIKNKLDAPVEITYSNETRDGEVFETVADIERARSGLEWEPKIGFELGIESCIRGGDLAV